MWMQAVDGRRSRCSWRAVGYRYSYPGQGLQWRIPANQAADALALTVT